MRRLFISPYGVVIENAAGNSVSFKDIQELKKYSGIDLVYTNQNEVTYEPERKIHLWFDGINSEGKPCPDGVFDDLINRVQEFLDKIDDPYFDLTDIDKKQVAYTAKYNALLNLRKRLNNIEPFLCNGVQYANDETNIQGVKVQILDKPRTEPLPTFPGTPVAGCWKSYLDEYVPMTNGEFIDNICESYFTMRTENFTNFGILETQLKEMLASEQVTFQEIEDFDITIGWSLISVV